MLQELLLGDLVDTRGHRRFWVKMQSDDQC